MGIYTASGAVALDFTGDAKTLLDTLANMRSHPQRGATLGFGSRPTLTAYQAYMIVKRLDAGAKAVAVADIRACSPQIPEEEAEAQAQEAAEAAWEQLRPQSTNLLNALLLIVRHLAAEPGSRMLLMVSPGFVTGDMERQTSALTDACLRGGVVVNALDAEGLLASGLDSPESLGAHSGPRVGWATRTLGLRTLVVTSLMAEAASTGGAFFHNNNDLNAGLRTLAEPPSVFYLLGFSPTDPPNDKYHKLRVTITNAKYEVSARPGYIATRPSERSESA